MDGQLKGKFTFFISPLLIKSHVSSNIFKILDFHEAKCPGLHHNDDKFVYLLQMKHKSCLVGREREELQGVLSSGSPVPHAMRSSLGLLPSSVTEEMEYNLT